MDVALFYQGTPAMKNASFTKKLMATELFASLQWLFIIPSGIIIKTISLKFYFYQK